jgi:hypothetical protein
VHGFQGRQRLDQFFHSRSGLLEGRMLIRAQFHLNDFLDPASA